MITCKIKKVYFHKWHECTCNYMRCLNNILHNYISLPCLKTAVHSTGISKQLVPPSGHSVKSELKSYFLYLSFCSFKIWSQTKQKLIVCCLSFQMFKHSIISFTQSFSFKTFQYFSPLYLWWRREGVNAN